MTEPTAAQSDASPLPADTLRVAFFSDSLSERNGTGAYYHDLLEYLAPRLGEARVIQPGARQGKDLLSLPLPGDPTQRLVLPNAFRVRREMAVFRPHVIVMVTPGPFGFLGLRTARRHGAAFISAYHTNFEGLADLYWGPVKRRLIIGTLDRVNRFFSRRSATVLVNNNGLVDTVRRLGAPQVDVMGTPLERSFVDTPARAVPTALRQVCFVGRLAAEKNIEAVIDAAARWPDIHFVIGGDGPQRQLVEDAAAQHKNIEYRGWLSRADLLELIDDSSLLVLPSHMETFGSVALEAMARGRPALVSENAGIHDWKTVAGGLYRLHHSETLADAIGRLRGLAEGALADKAETARTGALRLNAETVDQWIDVLTEHAGERR